MVSLGPSAIYSGGNGKGSPAREQAPRRATTHGQPEQPHGQPNNGPDGLGVDLSSVLATPADLSIRPDPGGGPSQDGWTSKTRKFPKATKAEG